MSCESSRRNFLAAGLALPAAGLALPTPAPAPSQTAATPAAPKLDYRVLGKTGVKVTTVGFGCMITSDPSVIAQGLDMGITYFDTARGYQKGNNERMVGAVLKGKRNSITLSSKSSSSTKAEAFGHLETSLRELGTDHLDVWYMHGKDKPDEINDDLVDAWLTAKQQGKIRFIGVSTHDPNAIVDRILEVGKFEVVLSTYNFTMARTRDETFRRLHQAGIGLVAMKVMAGGMRDRKPNPVMQREGAPLSALKWVIHNPLFSTTIPSMTDTGQLEMNFQAMGERFGATDEKTLAARLEQIRPDYCRMCFGCEGQCPKGLPVAQMLRVLRYADGYGEFPLARERFLELPREVRDVRCADCSSCAIQCPNGVHVAERLKLAQQLLA